ncbi:MAG: hypothetical protein OXU36_13935 [Candidatus Poribacteria bacterium]|nr:hypothetical protein [Candidatus Poribacteria bacterium]
MISVRIWNLEADHDAKAVKFLENQFLRLRQLEHLAIRTAGRSALGKCHKKGKPIDGCLQKAIQHYFKQDDYIIFVVDSDLQRQQASKSLINQLRGVVEAGNFSDKVFFCPDLQESESIIPTQWRNIVSRFRTEVESERKRLREEWDRTIAHFHNAFADRPEEEVIRHFEEALAEVRRERA